MKASPMLFRNIIVILGFGTCCVNYGSELMASEITRMERDIWTRFYHLVHAGEAPSWSTHKQMHDWAQRQQDELEPIVLASLRGERPDIPRQHGLLIARHIPTKAICDALYDHVDRILEVRRDNQFTRDNHNSVVDPLSILAQAHDQRATLSLNRLISSSTCSTQVSRTYLLALRSVGTKESIAALKGMPIRKTDERINRMAALTEKIIDARIQNKVFPPATVPQELRILSLTFVKAIEERDVANLRECFPAEMRGHMDEEQLAELVEWNQQEQALPTIRAALSGDIPFVIDREELRAKLVCDNRYIIQFIYEIDGWRIMNVSPIPVSREKRPPPVYPENPDGKRIFIGRPADNHSQN